jgi:hypothetical protein
MPNSYDPHILMVSMLCYHYQRALCAVREQPLGSERRKHKNNIKVYLREVSRDSGRWVELAEDHV